VLSLATHDTRTGREEVVFERRLAEVDRGLVDTVIRRVDGSPDSMVEYAGEADRLLCLATAGGSHLRHPIRSRAASRLASHGAHPILTVGRRCAPERRTGIRRLIVPLDGTEAGEHALDVATLWAMAFDLELELVQVHRRTRHAAVGAVGDRSPASSDVLECASVRRQAADLARAGVVVTYDVLHSRHRNPAPALMGHARATAGAVLVISTEGHLGLRSTSPANVAHQVVANAPVPVLVTHSDETDELPAQQFLTSAQAPERGGQRQELEPSAR
jgi:nucleotide-binding universal stress UspA family protein